jgi:hypothetical protein
VTRRRATAAVACALAAVLGAHCTSISGDANAPLAIEFVFPRFVGRFTVEEFDTVPISVRVLNRSGDSIPGATAHVVSFSPETLFVDTLPLQLIGRTPGVARLLATSGSLQALDTVTVVRAPDSLALAAGAADTLDVKTTDTVSAPMQVSLLDLRTDSAQALAMSGYRVVFTIVQPLFANPVAATVVFGNDTVPSVVDTVTTSNGVGSAILRRRGGPQPDSVIVQASAKRANGAVVHGSPVQFVVRFQ